MLTTESLSFLNTGQRCGRVFACWFVREVQKPFANYAEKINKQEGRQGSLFQKNFKRRVVLADRYFTELVYYIHANPQKHGFCFDFKTYRYSSYLKILETAKTSLQKEYVLKWFGGNQEYLKCHNQYIPTEGWPDWILD